MLLHFWKGFREKWTNMALSKCHVLTISKEYLLFNEGTLGNLVVKWIYLSLYPNILGTKGLTRQWANLVRIAIRTKTIRVHLYSTFWRLIHFLSLGKSWIGNLFSIFTSFLVLEYEAIRTKRVLSNCSCSFSVISDTWIGIFGVYL